MVLQQFGSMPKHLATKNTELFGREVLPGLRSVWSEWEDRWYPKMLPAEQRARPAPLPQATNGTANGAARQPETGTAHAPAGTRTGGAR
jgi:hypothetical protein